MTTKKLIRFTHDQLREALLYTEDLFDRALVPFVLLGDMAKQMIDEEMPLFKANNIQVAVQERYLSASPVSIMKMVNPNMLWTPNYIRFDYHGVPVEIKIIRKDYKFFQHPDFRFYALTSFNVPNPFENYWRVRNLIR